MLITSEELSGHYGLELLRPQVGASMRRCFWQCLVPCGASVAASWQIESCRLYTVACLLELFSSKRT